MSVRSQTSDTSRTRYCELICCVAVDIVMYKYRTMDRKIK